MKEQLPKAQKEQLLEEFKPHILPGPLNGVVVVGFCYYVAGPIALQTLVRQGALVIKIEGKPGGDPSRNVFSPAIFNSLAHGQLSIAFDSKNPEDRRLLQSLLKLADVIVDNRTIDAQERDTILQDHLNSDKPNPVIYCAIHGYPNATVNRMPGLDASAQAVSGFAYTNCASPTEPLKVGAPILDIVTGLLTMNHVMGVLYHLQKNTGFTADVPIDIHNTIKIAGSLVGTSMWLQSNQAVKALMGEPEYLRTGNQDPFAAPFSYYRTKDGFISIATVNEDQFKNFCIDVLKNKSFHEKYPTVKKRIEDQDNFERELNVLLETETREYWFNECKKYKVPAALVLNMSEAVQQGFVRKDLLAVSSDGKPIVTAGISNTLFNPRAITHAPAPAFDEHHQRLARILKEEKPDRQPPSLEEADSPLPPSITSRL